MTVHCLTVLLSHLKLLVYLRRCVLAIRSGYLPRYPSSAYVAVQSPVLRPSRQPRRLLLLFFLLLLVLLQGLWILGSYRYWHTELDLTRDGWRQLWENLRQIGSML